MLNDLFEFEGLNPSIEHFSRIVCEKLLVSISPPGSGRFTVKIWENESCWAAHGKDYKRLHHQLLAASFLGFGRCKPGNTTALVTSITKSLKRISVINAAAAERGRVSD